MLLALHVMPFIQDSTVCENIAFFWVMRSIEIFILRMTIKYN